MGTQKKDLTMRDCKNRYSESDLPSLIHSLILGEKCDRPLDDLVIHELSRVYNPPIGKRKHPRPLTNFQPIDIEW